jgi:hypothetical protein
MKINHKELKSQLPIEPSNKFWDNIKKYPIELVPLTKKSRDECILGIVNTLMSEDIAKAGSHRKQDWTIGWGKNLAKFKETLNLESLTPGYYNKYPFLRYNSELYSTSSANDELYSVRILLNYITDVWLRHYSHIIELGAGTCHHLNELNQINTNKATYYALDWNASTIEISDLLRENGFIKQLKSFEFDFFKPKWPSDITIPASSETAIYSFAALEQIGENYSSLVDFIINKLRPAMVVNLEPIEEVLPDDELLPSLSKAYFRKRNYLKGYLTYIKELEKRGLVKIHCISRMPFGSYYIEGYSLVVWSPELTQR